MTALRGALADATSVVRNGAVLLWQYWPTLLTIFLFGQAVRAAALWGAMVTTKWSPLAGALLVPLAPLATVAALILALRVVAPSLRWATFRGTPGAQEREAAHESRRAVRGTLIEDRLALLASTLIPFFAVYAAQGYLREDTRQFLNDTASDEFLNNADFWLGTGQINFERTSIAQGWWFWGAVAVAFGIRWLIERLELPKKGTAWGWLAAYVEVTWVALFATGAMNKIGEWIDWFKNRQAAASAQQAYEQVTDSLGGPGAVIDQVLGFIAGAIGKADAIVLIPMAWLTVGAVVYGRTLSQARKAETSERSTQWAERAKRVPSPVRRVGREVFGGAISRFNGLAGAVRTFARAGLAPMLLFCLVFVLAKQAEVGTAWVLRELIGPQDPDVMVVVAPYLALIRRAVYTVLMVSLLAAAVDRMLRPDSEPQDTTDLVAATTVD